MHLAGAGGADSLAGDIVRVHAHAAAEHQQITTPVQMGTDGFANKLGIIRSKGDMGHFRTQSLDLFAKNRRKTVLD